MWEYLIVRLTGMGLATFLIGSIQSLNLRVNRLQYLV
jgi:hypothetical protein